MQSLSNIISPLLLIIELIWKHMHKFCMHCKILYHVIQHVFVKVQVTQLCLTLCDPMDCNPSGSSVHGESPQEHWSGLPCPPPGDLPNPGIEPRSPTLQVDSLPAEPQEKPKNTGVGRLSLLQGIFQTQESNQGLLHCRQILRTTELSGKWTYMWYFLIGESLSWSYCELQKTNNSIVIENSV